MSKEPNNSGTDKLTAMRQQLARYANLVAEEANKMVEGVPPNVEVLAHIKSDCSQLTKELETLEKGQQQ